MNDRTRTSAAEHALETELARLERYDRNSGRICYIITSFAYAAGVLALTLMTWESARADGPMATMFLTLSIACFSVGEKLRRATRKRLRRLQRLTQRARAALAA
ncbi:hypothetical protein [Streptomyces sp. NPDC013489]|uniref:hypothetical protein n=1 Tax=Streptomyces sp. NPDC013489 TaxID=3155606 RepID=UPI0034112257